ncbi:MAG TPA: hypothetical protein VJJ23_02490 [Candidatus Nanoarchaeia archaeon]|nr:hypothetical protein [Candidatus Nanoarchaeia archaeon]
MAKKDYSIIRLLVYDVGTAILKYTGIVDAMTGIINKNPADIRNGLFMYIGGELLSKASDVRRIRTNLETLETRLKEFITEQKKEG